LNIGTLKNLTEVFFALLTLGFEHVAQLVDDFSARVAGRKSVGPRST